MREPVLVTGAAGFVGSHLIDALRSTGMRVCGVYRPDTPPRDRASVGSSIEWRAVDLLDREATAATVAELRPLTIFHCAGAAHVGMSFNRTTPTFETNVLGTHHLLDAVRRSNLPARVLVPGSGLVYRPSPKPLAEDDSVQPASPYALSKLAQELLGMHSFRDDGIEVLLPRAFNHIGPRQDPSYSASGFARQIALIEAGRSEPFLYVGNLDNQRDLSDVRDTVRAYLLINKRGAPGRIYNVCTGRARAIGDILEGLMARARVQVTVRTDPARLRPHDAALMIGDPSRIARELGWKPETLLDRTLDDLLAYWRQAVLQDHGGSGSAA